MIFFLEVESLIRTRQSKPQHKKATFILINGRCFFSLKTRFGVGFAKGMAAATPQAW